MFTLLHRIFVVNWRRKIVAFFAALILWFSINQSMTLTRRYHNIPVKIINLPEGKTIIGLQPNGLLQKRVSISVTGNKSFLSELNGQNLELVINAEGKTESWIPKIDKSNLISLASYNDLSKTITSVESEELFLHMTDQP